MKKVFLILIPFGILLYIGISLAGQTNLFPNQSKQQKVSKKQDVQTLSDFWLRMPKSSAQGNPGPPGPTGPQGIQGIQGYQGGQGPKGDTGNQGIQGFPGTPGADGTQGIQGLPGNDGQNGSQGIQGIPGIQGDPGPPGTTTWEGITDKPSTFTPSSHGHAPGEVTGTAVVTNDARLSDARTPITHDSTKHSVAYEAANSNIQTHVASTHAPSNAQKNSDITKAEIEAVLTGAISSHSHAGGSTPAWKGAIAGAWNDGDPNALLDRMLHNPLNATPTNIAITVARCAYFKLDTNLTVNKIRFFGVGATTNVYRVAIYQLSNLARLTAELPFTTVAQAWGAAGSALNVTLTANTIYLIAVSVNAIGTTAGVQCHSGTTGRIGVLPTGWPGNLDIDTALKINPIGFCQFAVTTGALPATAATLVLQAAWTGGIPAFFLDNSNL